MGNVGAAAVCTPIDCSCCCPILASRHKDMPVNAAINVTINTKNTTIRELPIRSEAAADVIVDGRTEKPRTSNISQCPVCNSDKTCQPRQISRRMLWMRLDLAASSAMGLGYLIDTPKLPLEWLSSWVDAFHQYDEAGNSGPRPSLTFILYHKNGSFSWVDRVKPSIGLSLGAHPIACASCCRAVFGCPFPDPARAVADGRHSNSADARRRASSERCRFSSRTKRNSTLCRPGRAAGILPLAKARRRSAAFRPLPLPAGYIGAARSPRPGRRRARSDRFLRRTRHIHPATHKSCLSRLGSNSPRPSRIG